MNRSMWTTMLTAAATVLLAGTPVLARTQTPQNSGQPTAPKDSSQAKAQKDSTPPVLEPEANRKFWMNVLGKVITQDTAPDGKHLVVALDGHRASKEELTKFIEGVRTGTVHVIQSRGGSDAEAKQYNVGPSDHLTVITTGPIVKQ